MSTADKAAAAPAAPATEEHKEDCARAAHKKPEPLYLTLNPNQEATVIESLCMNCYEQGTTRIMFLNVCHVPHKQSINSFLTPFSPHVQIPFFKEIIVSAFSCPHCGYESKDVQSGATIQRLGVRYTLTLNKAAVCFPFTPFSLFFSKSFILDKHANKNNRI